MCLERIAYWWKSIDKKKLCANLRKPLIAKKKTGAEIIYFLCAVIFGIGLLIIFPTMFLGASFLLITTYFGIGKFVFKIEIGKLIRINASKNIAKLSLKIILVLIVIIPLINISINPEIPKFVLEGMSNESQRMLSFNEIYCNQSTTAEKDFCIEWGRRIFEPKPESFFMSMIYSFMALLFLVIAIPFITLYLWMANMNIRAKEKETKLNAINAIKNISEIAMPLFFLVGITLSISGFLLFLSSLLNFTMPYMLYLLHLTVGY